MLNMLEGFDLGKLEPLGAERFHLAGRGQQARLSRARPASVPTRSMSTCRWRSCSTRRYAAALRERIDPERATAELPAPVLEPHADTVYLTVVDRDLNAVSFINSIYDAFGSGLVCPDTGVLFHSAAAPSGWTRAPQPAGAPASGRCTPSSPAMAFRGGELWMSFGVMGGDYQPVGHAHVLGNMVDYGMDPQAAIDAARAMAYPGDLQVERGISTATREGLEARGHRGRRRLGTVGRRPGDRHRPPARRADRRLGPAQGRPGAGLRRRVPPRGPLGGNDLQRDDLTPRMSLALVALLPFLGAVLPPLMIRGGRDACAITTFFVTLTSLVLLLVQAPAVFRGEVPSYALPWIPGLGPQLQLLPRRPGLPVRLPDPRRSAC